MMALRFYLSSQSGSDAHSGSSESVIAGGTGTAAVTQGDATVDLSAASPDLSGVNQGGTRDTIRLAGRTDGIHGTDIFEITAVDEVNHTVQVAPTPGSVSQSGLDWCIGGAWHRPQKAMEVVSAGDHVWWKADGDYMDNSGGGNSCARLQRAAGATAPIVLEGYRLTPGDADAYRAAHPELRPGDAGLDAYRATVNGAVNGLVDGIGVIAGLGGVLLHYVFKNVRVCHCAAAGFSVGPQNERGVRWENCRSDGNLIGLGAYQPEAFFCSLDHNTLFGTAGQSHQHLYDCDVMDNGDDGISSAAGDLVLVANRICRNGGNAINGSPSSGMHCIIHNTLDGDGKPAGKSGLRLYAGCRGLVAGNIIHDFAVGARCDPGHPGDRLVVRNNLYTNNTVDRSGFPEGAGDVAGEEPGFLDEAGGDYRLRFDSPARGAGWPSHTDIGSAARREVHTHGPTDLGVQA